MAVGQLPDLAFLEGSAVSRHKVAASWWTPRPAGRHRPGIYAGGDVVDRAESIIAACADGRRAAEAICAELWRSFAQPPSRPAVLSEQEILCVKRVRGRKDAQRKPADGCRSSSRGDFELIESTLTEEAGPR